MFYSQDRATQRKFLYNAWQKFINNEPLEALEAKLAQIISIHKEYHNLINNIYEDYLPEAGKTNPFLHINLHLALREQLAIDRPRGIKKSYNILLTKINDSHKVEHLMMDCIANMIFLAQKSNTNLDEEKYLDCIQKQIINFSN